MVLFFNIIEVTDYVQYTWIWILKVLLFERINLCYSQCCLSIPCHWCGSLLALKISTSAMLSNTFVSLVTILGSSRVRGQSKIEPLVHQVVG